MYEKLITNLQNKGYEALYFENSEDAKNYLNNKIDNKTVGIGGSITIKDMDLYDLLKTHNNVLWHWMDSENAKEILQKAKNSEVYLLSVNALSEDGEIVNIDGISNRISASSFGPQDVYFVVGRNKVTDNLHEAIDRARNVAAPLNAKRLNKKTPCVIDLKCHDCKGPERICRNMQILFKAPSGCKYHVIIINEDLGY